MFALSRNRLGKALGKVFAERLRQVVMFQQSMRMSAASVHDVDGVYEMYVCSCVKFVLMSFVLDHDQVQRDPFNQDGA